MDRLASQAIAEITITFSPRDRYLLTEIEPSGEIVLKSGIDLNAYRMDKSADRIPRIGAIRER
jgi:hypothetical protein